jgi:hypothetical protein
LTVGVVVAAADVVAEPKKSLSGGVALRPISDPLFIKLDLKKKVKMY